MYYEWVGTPDQINYTILMLDTEQALVTISQRSGPITPLFYTVQQVRVYSRKTAMRCMRQEFQIFLEIYVEAGKCYASQLLDEGYNLTGDNQLRE